MSIVAILFLLVLGIASIYAAQKIKRDDEIVGSWPTTSGKILKSEVIGGSRSGNRLVAEYEFFIDGTRHQSNFIYRGNPHFSLGSNYNLDELDFLKNPQVKYDPNNPKDSCLLLYASPWYMVILYGVGGLLIFIGLIGLIGRFL
ncbi:MAG: hypothetical protein RI909_1898 [Bacteroidota bacterium]|jgi:hypothetical protein